MKLLQELFADALLSEKERNELQTEVEKTGKTEEEIILERKIVSENELFKIKSKISKIPLKRVKAEEIPLDVLKLIPEEAAMNYKMAALAKSKDFFEIGMVYPEDVSGQNALRFLSRQEGFSYKIFLITFTDLNNLLGQYRTLKSETKRALEELEKEKKEILGALEVGQSPKVMAEEAPIIKMVLVILKHAIDGNASDIHIEPSRDKLTVRFRQDGVLYPSLFLPLSVHLAIAARVKIMASLKIDENRIPQDGRFSAKLDNKDIDFRVATFPTLYGEKVEIRVLDPKEGLKSLKDLGLRERNFELVKEAIKRPYGLILSTGPTGSGKTTTLYALLQILNKDNVNIVTIEDPIEYSIAGINQSQIKPEIGYDFARGLRQILRQDPNIIMVGEIRDEETASLATQAALTGHIVLSSLHTNNSIGVIPRLIDMGVRPFLIPSTLRVAISQRLIRVLCSHCKRKVVPAAKIKSHILNKIKNFPPSAKKEFRISEPLQIYEAKGCELCDFKGYIGRKGLFEVLFMTDELADALLKNPVESLIFQVARNQGMLTMEEEGILKVLEGVTTIEEITRVQDER
ncbi:MAG: Flp pilus assembly complex ATPase component TadA [Candidatus Staskawiczbacteria bacterium]|nr:Flp pilus assembly complex ATPase component TadA [Candidatus Staskawiczbacteria bacterium]